MKSPWFALSLVACTSTSTPAAVPARESASPNVVEIAEAEAADEPEAPSAPEPAVECKTTRYQVERIDMSSPTCTVDIPAIGSVATLECAGGRVNLRFDKKDYTGTIDANGLVLDLVSTYDFTDGCLWEATARVIGAPGSLLRLDYTERTTRGTQCSDSCTAVATIVALP